MNENTNSNENIKYLYEYYNMLYPKKFKEKERIRLLAIHNHEKNNKHVEKINKRKLAEMICDVTAIPYDVVSLVLDSLEKNVFDILSSASQDADVQVKLFDGLIMESKHSESKTKRDNFTGKTIIVSERLNVTGRITRLLEKKINQ